ncbi:MAG: hypothetical protein NTV54_16115 [Ignavibacteriales bacterium]|nr:hypothetical protein [Ignavibacteriales bacterium]
MSNQISTNQILLNLSSLSDGFDKISSKLSTGKKINAAKEEPVAWTSVSKRDAKYNELTSVKESLGEVAASIHEADSTMGVINGVMDQMKSTLQQITKSFPPYPPGSEERIKLLKTFAAFRQQIEDLTFPPDAGAKKILSAGGDNEWTIAIGSDGMARTVRKEEVHPGPTGLNIPDLTINASDTEINSALDSLEKASVTLQDKRERLAVDAAGIARTDTFTGAMATVNKRTSESDNAADMNDAAAQLKSIDIQQSLSYATLNISSQIDSKILRILG